MQLLNNEIQRNQVQIHLRPKFVNRVIASSLRCVATLLVCLYSIFTWADTAPDYERETRLTEEAEAGLFDGEIVNLNDGQRDFFSIQFEPNESKMSGAVIVLHGRGFHADWPQVAGPLRVGLTEAGWTTLSLQMPVLEKDAKYYDYLEIIPLSFARLEAGVRYLREQNYQWVALIAHSCSVHMSMAWIKQVGDGQIDAYAGIGVGATDYKQPMLEPFPLEFMAVPVLDVYGSEDYPAVVRGAEKRRFAIIEAGNALSQQTEIEGPDHFFEDYEDELISVVSMWLSKARK